MNLINFINEDFNFTNYKFSIIFSIKKAKVKCRSGSDAQRRIIDNQLFLLKEGMISEKLFKKAKKFDDKGIFWNWFRQND